MSTALQPQQTADKLSIWVHQPENYAPIAAAVGEVMNPDTFIAHMMVSLNDPKIAQKSNASKAKAIMKCAAVGMLPTLGQVALVPYGDDIEATIQWQGYKAQFERIQGVLEAQATLVHNTDVFSFDEKTGELIHKFNPLNPAREVKKLTDIQGGYLRIIFTDGRPPKYHFVTVRQIEKCRACAKTKNVWDGWTEQMALKTIYRDAYARRVLPIDPLVLERMERVINADDIDMGNNPNRINEDFPSLADRLNRKQIKQEERQQDQPADPIPQEEAPQAESEPEQPPQPSGNPGEFSEKEQDMYEQWEIFISGLDSKNEIAAAMNEKIDADYSPAMKSKIHALCNRRMSEIHGKRGERSN